MKSTSSKCVGTFICAVFLCGLAACSSSSKNQATAKKAVSGMDEQIFLGDTIEKNYDPNVIMKRGESFFEKEEYVEAIVEYTHFLDLHRSHILAPYAAYRVGESHFKMAKTVDRDPDPVNKAIAAFERLRKEYPGSRYDPQAIQKIQECHDWLAQVHLLVGQFYYRRGSYLAAAHRFEQIIKEYPDKTVAPDALYFLAQSYHDMGADDWAAEQLTLLTERYPESKAAADGRSLLAKIGTVTPKTLVARQEVPAPDSNSSTPLLHPPAPQPPNGSAPSAQAGALRIPTAKALSQSFISCHLGAWC